MVFRAMMVAFRPLRTILLPDGLSGRHRHGDRDRPLHRLAGRGPGPHRATHPRSARPARGCLPLPPALRGRLLQHAPAQSLPAALRQRPQGRPDRPAHAHQSPHRLAATGALLQGGPPAGPPPHGRPALRQVAAALRRPHRPVPPQPPPRHPRRPDRLHRPDLPGARLAHRPVQVPQEVRPRPGHGCGTGRPRPPAGRRRAGSDRRGHPACGSGAGRPPGPAGAPGRLARRGGGAPLLPGLIQCAGAPFLLGRTQYAGAFLLLGPALGCLAAARDCLADPCGGLTRGLLTSIFALVVGLRRVYHLDEGGDPGFALLTGGRRCPSRHLVGGWRRHLRWYEVDAFCRRTSPWHLITGEIVLASYDEHTVPRWTSKFHIEKGYVTTRNKYMRCEKLFYSFDLCSGRYLAVRA